MVVAGALCDEAEGWGGGGGGVVGLGGGALGGSGPRSGVSLREQSNQAIKEMSGTRSMSRIW